MAMNISLLLAARERILAEPENYNQSTYCGTRYCIAGHAVRIELPKKWLTLNGFGVMSSAKSILGLTNEQFDRLCSFSSYWPQEFCDRYGNTRNPYIRAQVAAEAIIDFIITDGWTKPADWKALAEVSPNLTPAEVEQESSPLTLA